MDDLKDRIIAANNSNTIFDIIQEVYYEDRKNEKALPELLTELNNSGRLNIVQAFQSYKNTSENHDFFSIRSVFEEILPKLNTPIKEVASCVRHLTLEAGQDMAAYMLITPFKEFCHKDIHHPSDLYKLSLSNIDEEFDHLSIAIIAGTYFDEPLYVNRAVELLNHDNETVRLRAIYALGRIIFTDVALRKKSANEIVNLLMSNHSDKTLSTALGSLFAITRELNELQNLYLDFLNKYKEYRGEKYIHAAANLLFFEKDRITKSEERILLEVCCYTPPENIGTIRNIDYALQRLLKQGDFNTCIEFLEKYFELNEYKTSIDAFDNFIRELRNYPDTYLSELITRWLLSRKVVLGKFCISLLNENSSEEELLSADFSQIEASSEFDRIFLARKACGWFYHRPISATSFMLSLLNGADPEEKQKITSLIFNPLLIGYNGKVKRHLKDISDQFKDNTVINLLSELDLYHSKLNKTQVIKELDIPTSHKEAHYRKQSEEFARSYEEAQKGGLMSLIGVKHSVILHGEGSIHYMYRGKDDEPVRQETQMNAISTSYEVPILTIVDPHGLDKMLQHFRLEGCTS